MSIPFDVPLSMMPRLFSGEIVRNGALLREVGSGRIVAHLQETTGLARALSSGFNPLKMAAEGVQVYQNEQIKAGIAVLQTTGVANLALTGISIGVSVVGFALVQRQLDRLEGEIKGVAAAVQRVSLKVDKLRDHLLRQELSDLRAELRRIDEAWLEHDVAVQAAQWRHAADRLLNIEERFKDHAHAAVEAGEAALRDLLIEAYVLAAEARRSALLAAGSERAEEAARSFHTALSALTGSLGAAELMQEALATAEVKGLAARSEAITRLRPHVEAKASALRDREEMVGTIPLTIAALRDAQVSGREWLGMARSREEMPVLCLSVS